MLDRIYRRALVDQCQCEFGIETKHSVVVWHELLSDGSICYAAVYHAVNHAHGQGDTEAEALADVADAIALFLEHIPGDFVKTDSATEDEMNELLDELLIEGVKIWTFQVEPRRLRVPA